MVKKFLIAFTVFLVFAGAFGLYGALYYRNGVRQQRQVAKAPQASLTFLEGWSNQDYGNLLEQKQIITAKDFLNLQKQFDPSSHSLLASKPASADLQGFLFPDTYEAFLPSNSLSTATVANLLIKKMLDNFSLKFTPAMQAQAQTDGMSVYQIITLASIIEKESGRNAVTTQEKTDLSSERENVAEVFYNRLKIGMPLESDATVNYITHKSTPSVSAEDTQIDSPYNTYKFKGLPPGPICNPSLDSIMAALYPASGDYLYFLTDPSTGKAIFATTYDQQIMNKQKYLK